MRFSTRVGSFIIRTYRDKHSSLHSQSNSDKDQITPSVNDVKLSALPFTPKLEKNRKFFVEFCSNLSQSSFIVSRLFAYFFFHYNKRTWQANGLVYYFHVRLAHIVEHCRT